MSKWSAANAVFARRSRLRCMERFCIIVDRVDALCLDFGASLVACGSPGNDHLPCCRLSRGLPTNLNPPGGDHNVYITLIKRYFAFLIVPLDIAVLAWWSRSTKPRLLMITISTIVGLGIAVFVGARWASSAWFQTIPPTIARRAGSAANSRPFCLVVGGKPAEHLSQLAIGSLENAFSSGMEYYGYYALLKIEGEAGQRNWSFRVGDFVSASLLFHVDCQAVPGGFLKR